VLTVQYARAVPEVKFNAVEPGYTATELGGMKNEHGRPVEVSAGTIVRRAAIGKDGPIATFQEDDGELAW
jgi:NAD(P)-dependent dehydrogenase (short-subunit alcohol dehydrogenase family)